MPLSIGFLSTYPPTQCGLATFTASLRVQLVAAGWRCGVVRVVDRPERRVGPEIVCHLEPESRSAQVRAAGALDGFDVAIVQHEFGIYGGSDGDDVLGVLDSVTVPVIVVLHTVLSAPTPHQRAVLERVVARAQAVVTMTATARARLLQTNDIDASQVVVIPHGADEPHVGETAQLRQPTLLTWGLLGPGKGIESVIDAMPAVRKLEPRLRYRVVGQTHPRVLERDGEAYRTALTARAAELDVTGMVSFEAGYLDGATLGRVVAEAHAQTGAHDGLRGGHRRRRDGGGTPEWCRPVAAGRDEAGAVSISNHTTITSAVRHVLYVGGTTTALVADNPWVNQRV